jgi:hypothetical protein
LFATLAGRSISVAVKGVRRKVDSNQWTVVSGQREGGEGE